MDSTMTGNPDRRQSPLFSGVFSRVLFSMLCCLWLGAPGAAQEPAGSAQGPARQLVVEGIEITGNFKTRPTVIHRYLTVAAGEPISPEDLLISEQRLSETEFFKQVDVYTRPGSEKGRLVVVVEIEERKWPRFRFEGGNGELDGWYIVPVGFHFDNFSGRGQRLAWTWRVGNRMARESLHYQHPYLFSGAGLLDIHLFGQEQNFPHYVDGADIDELVRSMGISARLEGREGRYRNAFLHFRSQRYDPDSNILLEERFGEDFGKTRVVALALGMEGDTRDNAAFPTAGKWGRVLWEVALNLAGDDVGFTRLELDARTYRKLGERNVLAVRGHLGYVGEEAPFFERFYLGGPYSLRGYPTGWLTPVGWGNRLFLAQSEIRFPLSEERFPKHRHTAVVYYDVGGIWSPGETPGLRDLDQSLGAGYRLRMKVLGVLRIDFSLPVGQVEENDFRFQLSLGNAF